VPAAILPGEHLDPVRIEDGSSGTVPHPEGHLDYVLDFAVSGLNDAPDVGGHSLGLGFEVLR